LGKAFFAAATAAFASSAVLRGMRAQTLPVAGSTESRSCAVPRSSPPIKLAYSLISVITSLPGFSVTKRTLA